MEIINKEFYKTNVTLRITALWAFCESFLGGILHGLKMPFSGLVLAFIASVCITLIAIGNAKKGEILKATFLVIAINFILSPHTPPMAYLAVLVQGAAGELLFLNKKFIKPAAFVLTLFSLIYSELQHLITLTIIFGKNFWQALDIFLNKITQSLTHNSVHYSLYLVLLYLGCYLITGILGGIFNVSIINKTAKGSDTSLLLQKIKALPNSVINVFENKENHNKKWFKLLFGFLMVLLLILSYLPFISDMFAKYNFAKIFIRGIIIICVWLYCITPLLQYQIKKWFYKYKENNSNTIQQIMLLFPAIKLIIQQSWLVSQQNKLRIKHFIYNTILLIVHNEE